MKKSKRKQKIRRTVLLQRSPPPLPSATPEDKRKSIWKRLPGWLWTLLCASGVIVGLFVLYPTLSINEDYSFDTQFPYNTSFSVTDEGMWPIADVSVTCSADFTMRPWTILTNPADKSQMDLHTKDDEHKNFARSMRFKQRLTLPCNHNVVANGHYIDPGAKLQIVIRYRFKGTGFHHQQLFNFHTVMGWHNQSYWQYDAD